jgi:chromate transporter
MLKVGLIGFGGGSALIPVMEKELVTPRGGLSEKAFVHDTVIANITPGALPVKLAALSGIQLGGPLLAMLSALIVALPGTAVTVALLALFAALGPGAIEVVEYASLGITAFILYLLAHYVTKVIRSGGHRHRRAVYILIAVVAYLATGTGETVQLAADLLGVEVGIEVPELSALGLILVAIGGIAAFSIYEWLRYRPAGTVESDDAAGSLRRVILAIVVMIALTSSGILAAVLLAPAEGGAFLGLVTVSTLSSFGGGEAYVGVADGFFVASGMVGSAEFYGQIVPVANALPGPILVKIASGVGYVLGLNTAGPLLGLILAVAAYLVSIGACCAVALGVLAGYDKARHSLFVRNIASFILPVICGLLASTSVAMLHSNARIGGDAGLAGGVAVVGSVMLAVGVAVLHRFVKVPDIIVIAACGAFSLAVLLAI